MGLLIDAVHADTSTEFKTTEIQVSQARYNLLKTEYNKLTASTGELTSIFSIPVTVNTDVPDNDVKYLRDYVSDREIDLASVFA